MIPNPNAQDPNTIIRSFLEKTGQGKALLLSGHVKSGNTWLRFLIFNYFRIKNHSAQETLTYKELNALQSHKLEGFELTPFAEGYPPLVRTHLPYHDTYDLFYKTIYMARHPLDTLISLFHANVNEKQNPDALHLVNELVEQWLPNYINHYTATAAKCDIVVKYEDLRTAPQDVMQKLFAETGLAYDADVMSKSIEMSSFKSIRNMEDESGQHQGNHAPDAGGRFARSGKSQQYLNELKPETIERCLNALKQAGISV